MSLWQFSALGLNWPRKSKNQAYETTPALRCLPPPPAPWLDSDGAQLGDHDVDAALRIGGGPSEAGDKRDEAMTHIQKSVKSASRSSLSASELGSEVGRNF